MALNGGPDAAPTPEDAPRTQRRAAAVSSCDRRHIECHSQVLAAVANCQKFRGFGGDRR